MKTLKSQLKAFDKDVKKRINVYKIKYAQLILFNLINETPVDTSKALSNWIVSLHKAKNKVITAHSVGTHGSTQTVSSGMAYSIGNAVIQRAKVGEIVYISNNVDYIELLNMGSSPQAERHFIQKAVLEAMDQALRVKL